MRELIVKLDTCIHKLKVSLPRSLPPPPPPFVTHTNTDTQIKTRRRKNGTVFTPITHNSTSNISLIMVNAFNLVGYSDHCMMRSAMDFFFNA